jgi:cob(I)alamin adenosyltransferase
MPRITKVTTRRGDSGETNLGSHVRVFKDASRVQAYGTVDELNSAIGLALAFPLHETLGPVLQRIQNELLDVGADLAMPPHPDEDAARRMDAGDVTRLEQDEAALLADLEPLTNFVLPGGSPGAAQLHVARTVCRRAEREVVSLGRIDTINSDVLRYLNRLSDLLFVMARVQSKHDSVPEPVWQPRATAEAIHAARSAATPT